MDVILSYKVPKTILTQLEDENTENKFMIGYQYCINALNIKSIGSDDYYKSILKAGYTSYGLEGALMAKYIDPDQRIECIYEQKDNNKKFPNAK